MKNNTYKPSQLRAFLTITWMSFRAQTRNKSTFFFGFLFPLVFISIFGLIGNTNSQITVGIPATSNQKNIIMQTLNKQEFLKLDRDTQKSLEQKLEQGKVSSIISVTQVNESSQQYAVHIKNSTASPQNAATVISYMNGIIDQANLRLSGVTNPPITLEQTTISGREFRYIDFALPGMIGFSLLSTAIFGTVFGLIFLKKSLVIKRMFATPMQPLTFLFAQGTSRLIVALAQTVLILLIGVFVFHFYLPQGLITFIELIVLSMIGLVAFLGFGYFMAGLVNDENSANPMINLVTLPQFLLSGTFFPIDSLPSWIQPVAQNLPLSYFNEAIRKITTEAAPFDATLPYLLGLCIWGAAMYILAAKTFKWE